MGSSAVAVLHYDHTSEIHKASPRLAEAMRAFPGARGDSHAGNFGFGNIVSWDHSSGYQVCVIHGNTGWRVGSDENPPPKDILDAVANALRVHGYRVTKPMAKV